MPLADYERVIRINLIGTFNMMRLAAAAMQSLPLLPDGDGGVIVSTASIAAFEGQIGQAAYSSSKGGVAALTLPAAREFAQFGVRVNAIAPGIFLTPMLMGLTPQAQECAELLREEISRTSRAATLSAACCACLSESRCSVAAVQCRRELADLVPGAALRSCLEKSCHDPCSFAVPPRSPPEGTPGGSSDDPKRPSKI